MVNAVEQNVQFDFIWFNYGSGDHGKLVHSFYAMFGGFYIIGGVKIVNWREMLVILSLIRAVDLLSMC